MVEFKWNSYGKMHHCVGLMVHFIQVIIITVYVKMIYIDNTLNDCRTPCDNPYALGLLFGVIYAIIYEAMNILRQGLCKYFSNLGNIYSWFYIISTLLTTWFHYFSHPFTIEAKASMVFSLFLVTDRTFKFMSIFESFSPICVMITKVVWDLKIFLLFYIILISMFSIVAGVIGYGNSNLNVYGKPINRDYTNAMGKECLGNLPESAKSEACEES